MYVSSPPPPHYPHSANPSSIGTTQACALRDSQPHFTASGYSIYGLSGDAPADNAKFRAKQNLGYPLICDPTYAFHEKLGVKAAGPKLAGVRSVVVVAKDGTVKEHKGVTAKGGLDVAKKAVAAQAEVVVPPAAVEEKKEEGSKPEEAKA